jgi:hypothetical protein
MPDYLRTALLLEEKAAKLPRGSERRALLAMATRARRLAIGLAPTDYGNSIGSFHKQVEVWVATVGKMPDGPAKDKLRLRAERAAIQGALAGLLMIHGLGVDFRPLRRLL